MAAHRERLAIHTVGSILSGELELLFLTVPISPSLARRQHYRLVVRYQFARDRLAGAWLLTLTISAYLYEASEIDPASVIGAAMLLLAAAAVASWLPLMKATAIEPMAALRDE